MNRNRHGMLAMLLCAALALLLAGCGGDDGVSPTTHSDLQSDYDALKDRYDAAVAQIGAMTDAASNAADASLWARINYHMEMIGSPNDMADAMGSLNAQLNHYMAMIGDPADMADAMGSLNARINHYMAMIGSMQDMPDPDGSLNAQINSYKAMIGDPADMADAMGSLNAQINHYMGMIGSMDDAADMSGSLYAQLNHYKGMIGDPSDAANENGSLNAQIAYYKARVKALEEGTAPDVIAPIAKAAMDAYDEANRAYEAADEAADEAETADDNRATIQTGMYNSVEDAKTARIHADTAMEERDKAKTASDTAQDAANTADATAQRIIAEDARDAAKEAQGMAEEARNAAVADAGMELKIDGTMKRVGDTTIDADAPNNVRTTGTGATRKEVNTGLQNALTEEMTGLVTGQPYTAADPAATPPTAAVPYRQAVAVRDIDIGKEVDSADDMARLAIITQYVGTKTVKVFAYAEADPPVTTADTTTGRTGTEMGKVTVINNSSADDVTAGDHINNTSLRSLGMYYPVAQEGTTDAADSLEATDTVADGTEGVAVYSYVDFGADRARGGTGGDADTTVYLVMDSERTDGDTTTYVYRSVDIMAPAAPDGADIDTAPDQVEVTANIPEATDYDHIHFGVWAALDEDGADPSAHGIGFVQNHSGEGMTAVMPNFGSATYNGNWVATVQMADPDGNGAISMKDGKAELTADFVDDDITVDLMGLAMLEGDISENKFSGTKATVGTNMLNLTAGGFTGSFNGGFFGVGAAEAGGVFSFGSDNNEDGAFAGAFGGVRE